MSYKVKFVKVCSNLDEIKFKTRCEFCEILSNSSNEPVCNFCKRYLHYVPKNSCAIYTFRNLFIEVAQRKNILGEMSWFDFQNLECELLDICEQTLEVQYNSENLSFYLDLSNYDEVQKSILNTFDIFHNKLVKDLDISSGLAFQANEYLAQQLLKWKTSAKKEMIYTNICLSTMKQPQNLTINREKLYEMFCDKFEF